MIWNYSTDLETRNLIIKFYKLLIDYLYKKKGMQMLKLNITGSYYLQHLKILKN